MAQHKFGTCRRAMLSFERQPFPTPCHVDQDVAHSRAWRALRHLTTFDRVLSALHRRNHLPVPPGPCTQPMLPRGSRCGQHLSRPEYTSRPIVTFAPQHTCALCGSALYASPRSPAGFRVISKHDRRCWPVKRPRHRLQTNPTPRQAMLADGRTVIGYENWRAHQACATLE